VLCGRCLPSGWVQGTYPATQPPPTPSATRVCGHHPACNFMGGVCQTMRRTGCGAARHAGSSHGRCSVGHHKKRRAAPPELGHLGRVKPRGTRDTASCNCHCNCHCDAPIRGGMGWAEGAETLGLTGFTWVVAPGVAGSNPVAHPL